MTNRAGNLNPVDSARVAAMCKQVVPLLRQSEVWNLNIRITPEMGGRGLPPIFLNTLPKSGSMFLEARIVQPLRIFPVRISGGTFPRDLIMPTHLTVFLGGDTFTQEHLPASVENRRLLHDHVDRLVVHVRDPRQATLSWTHHIAKHTDQIHHRVMRSTFEPRLPDHYASWDFPERLDWQVRNYLPTLVDWIEGWVAAEADPDFRTQVLFTTFEEMQAEPQLVIEKILSFYDISTTDYEFDLSLPREGELHFRQGKVDEWRTVFTPDQIAIATEALPESLAERFGWEK